MLKRVFRRTRLSRWVIAAVVVGLIPMAVPPDAAAEQDPAVTRTTIGLADPVFARPIAGADIGLEVRISGHADVMSGSVAVFDGDTRLFVWPVVLDDTVYWTAPLSAGVHLFRAVYSGDDANSGSTSDEFELDVPKWDPVLTVSTGAANPLPAWEPDTAIVTVGAGLVSPTGQARFTVDGIAFAPVPVRGGVGYLRLDGHVLTVGHHTVQVSYSGDDAVNAGEADLPGGIVVVARTSSTTINLPFRRMVTGTRPVATVATTLELPGWVPASRPATGRVTLTGPFRASLSLVHGSAQLAIPASLAPGHYTLNATFAGTESQLPSRGSASFTVVKAGATVRAVPAPAADSSSRVTVSVTGGPGTPTGAVAVVCGHQRSGHVGLTHGSATVTLPAGTPGGRTVCRATYFGDGLHFGAGAAFTVRRGTARNR